MTRMPFQSVAQRGSRPANPRLCPDDVRHQAFQLGCRRWSMRVDVALMCVFHAVRFAA